ncbi:hypothetical protein GCM10028787_14510 [Brachybacterium horti]
MEVVWASRVSLDTHGEPFPGNAQARRWAAGPSGPRPRADRSIACRMGPVCDRGSGDTSGIAHPGFFLER